MPYDDSNIKKMIRDQLERKVGFSRSKVVSNEAKDLIRKILEVNVKKRYTLLQIMAHTWMNPAQQDENAATQGNSASNAENEAQTPSHQAQTNNASIMLPGQRQTDPSSHHHSIAQEEVAVAMV